MRLRRWAGLAVAGWAGWRLFGPGVAPRTSVVQKMPEAPVGRTVRAAEHEFFVREAGDPEATPLLLVHGWAYDSLATWHRVIPKLALRYRVITVDQRNHGKSDQIRGRYEIADIADDVAAVMDALRLGRVPVAGYSMGGMVAQELARRHPGRVEKLVLAATAAYPIPRRRAPIATYLYLAKGVGKISSSEVLWLSHRYLIGNGVVPEEHSRWLWEMLHSRDMDLYVEAGKAIWRFDSRKWVGSLGVPVLVIIPTEDQLIPPEAQYELAELLGEPQLAILHKARHEAMLTHADEIADAIASFC